MTKISATPAVVEYQSEVSIPGALRDRAVAHPDLTIIERRLAGAWKPVTASAFQREVTDLARGLVAWGLNQGDVVATQVGRFQGIEHRAGYIAVKFRFGVVITQFDGYKFFHIAYFCKICPVWGANIKVA